MTEWNMITTNEDNPEKSGLYRVKYSEVEEGMEYYAIEYGWDTYDDVIAWREVE